MPNLPTQRSKLNIADFDSMLAKAMQASPTKRQQLVWSFLEEVKWHGGTPLTDSSSVLFLVEYEQPLRLLGLITKMKAIELQRIPDTNLQYLKINAPFDACCEYTFTTEDAHFYHDPLNTQPLSFRDLSQFTMPGWTPAPLITPIPGSAKGRVDEIVWKSEALGYSRIVYVYLPPGFDSNRIPPYPFLLAGDGWSTLHQGRIDVILDNLLYLGKIEPLVAILVTTDSQLRNLEYDVQPEWRKFIIEELLPELRSRYHLSVDRDKSLVMGASFGGKMAADMAVICPETFGMVGAFAPALRKSAPMLFPKYQYFDRLPTKVFACMGNERCNTPEYYEWLNILRERGVELHTSEGNEGHSWSYWSKELPDMLEICFPKLP